MRPPAPCMLRHEEATDAGEHMLHASIEAGHQSAGAAQAAMTTGLNTAAQTLQRATDQITQAIGFGGPQFEELTRQSSRNVEAVTQASTVLVRGAQDVSREWLELAQSRLQKNLDGFNALARSRSLQEFAAAHTELGAGQHAAGDRDQPACRRRVGAGRQRGGAHGGQSPGGMRQLNI